MADTTAEYSALDDGSLRVRNRFKTESGYDEATGQATVVGNHCSIG